MPTNPHVLLLGGHGKVSLLLTPLLLARSWRVTSMIRDSTQKSDILEAGKNSPNLQVLIDSLEDKKSPADATAVLDSVKPDYVVWSAGAGGKGGPSRTNAIDRDAARCFISAAASSSFVKKFLMVSAISIRRQRASWWSEDDWAKVDRMNREVLPTYYKAKLAADELLAVLGERKGLRYIILRPGGLTDAPATRKVALGKTRGYGQVARADVADVAVRLLDTDAVGWFDLLEGDESVQAAVDRVVREKVNCVEGESLEEMEKDIA